VPGCDSQARDGAALPRQSIKCSYLRAGAGALVREPKILLVVDFVELSYLTLRGVPAFFKKNVSHNASLLVVENNSFSMNLGGK
jgi:hypothetical protein